jgi:CO dehydrogenase/acetyl-CoA synthase beta subunit
MQVELGGPKVKEKFELAKVRPMDAIETKSNNHWTRPKKHAEGSAVPFGILVEAAGQP